MRFKLKNLILKINKEILRNKPKIKIVFIVLKFYFEELRFY